MSDDDDPGVKTYVTTGEGYGVEDPDEGVSRMPYPGEMGPACSRGSTARSATHRRSPTRAAMSAGRSSAVGRGGL